MNPGRDLDALIAEKVMGLELCQCTDEQIDNYRLKYHGFCRFASNNNCNLCGCLYLPMWNPSSDIKAAWEVVEKLSHRNFSMHNDVGKSGTTNTIGGGWIALFHVEGGPMAYTEGETAPHAICLAALKAIGVTIPE